MFEISPVLAGTFDKPDYVPASSNMNRTEAADETNDSSVIEDSRRYSKFDHSASQVADASMSFGDFLDMVNPLQHIPVISSVYRAITGDSINPVSRVAGDMLYGGAFGVAGILAGGIGAVADSVMETKTGKDVTGTVMASLFGEDQPAAINSQPTMLTSANPDLAPAPQSAPTTPGIDNQGLPAIAAQAASAQVATNAAPAVRNKLPYGGALAPKIQNFHGENLKMAVSGATGLRIGNTVYANQLKNGMRVLPTAPVASKAATDSDTASATSTPPAGPVISALPSADASATPSIAAALNEPSTNASTASDNTIPSNLRDDALIMKALGLYQNSASYGGVSTVH